MEGFKRLLELGADPNIVFDDGNNVMYMAASFDDPRFLKTALAYGGNPNLVATSTKETPLLVAMKYSRKENAAILLDAGADINVREIDGNTLIIRTAYFGEYDLVYYFLERGADYTKKGKGGKDLMYAICREIKTAIATPEEKRWMNRVIEWLNRRGAVIPTHCLPFQFS